MKEQRKEACVECGIVRMVKNLIVGTVCQRCKWNKSDSIWKARVKVCTSCGLTRKSRGPNPSGLCNACRAKTLNWRGGKPKHPIRGKQFRIWAVSVKERDNFTCMNCGVRGGNLHSHHIYTWDAFPEKRYDLDNGITLCTTCHHNAHFVKKCQGVSLPSVVWRNLKTGDIRLILVQSRDYERKHRLLGI